MAEAAASAADVAHDRLRSAFRRASTLRPHDLVRLNLRFGGRPARLRLIGGPSLRRLARPFAHLTVPGVQEPPELLLDLWDESWTGIGPAEVPAAPTLGADLGVSRDGRFVSRRTLAYWSALDRSSGSLVAWVEDARRLDAFDVFTPLQSELALWYRDRGILPIHAAALQHAGRGALVAGPPGSGKTLTLLACLAGGFEWVADDRVGVEETEAHGFRAHSMYASIAALPIQPGRRHDYRGYEPVAVDASSCTKDFALLSELRPGTGAASASVDVIVLPRRTFGGASPGLRRATPRDTLVRMSATSLRLVPRNARAEAMERLGRLVSAVPSFWLEMNPDAGEAAELVGAALDGASL